MYQLGPNPSSRSHKFKSKVGKSEFGHGPSLKSHGIVVAVAGNRDLLRMLYHHHEEEDEEEDRPPVFSRPRLPSSVEIISEDTEVELDDTEAEVISRDSWNTPFPLPPHQEEPLCTEITEYVFPKAALSKQKQWR